MCQICLDALKLHFPNVTEEQQLDLLWSGTAYPAAEGKHVANQLKKLAESSGGLYSRAMQIAHN